MSSKLKDVFIPNEDELEVILKEYDEIEQEIKDLNSRLKELKAKQKSSDSYILKFMRKTETHEIETPVRNFTVKETERKKTLNYNFISEVLKRHIPDGKLIFDIMNDMEQSRETVKSNKLGKKVKKNAQN